MEECSVLIESTLPAEDKTSRWFNLPIDYELFHDLLGVEADSKDYQIIDMKLPFAGDIVRSTSVRRLNKLYFAYTDLSPEVQQAKKAVSDAQKALDAAKRNAKAAENEISELKNAGKEYQKALAAFEKAQAELEAAEKNTSARRQAQRDAQAALEAAKKALAAADAKVREKQQAYDAALLALEVRRQQNLLAQKNQSHVDTTPLVLKAKKIPGVQTEQGKEALPQMGDAVGKSAAVSSAGAVLTAFAGIMAMFGLTERRKRGN